MDIIIKTTNRSKIKETYNFLAVRGIELTEISSTQSMKNVLVAYGHISYKNTYDHKSH